MQIMGQRVLGGVLYSASCDCGDFSLGRLLSYEINLCLLVIGREAKQTASMDFDWNRRTVLRDSVSDRRLGEKVWRDGFSSL